MENQKIKLEFEVTPQMALLICMYLFATPKGNLTIQKALTETGVKFFTDLAQSIMDQITEKTDFDNLRMLNILSYLQNSGNTNVPPPNGFSDLLN